MLSPLPQTQLPCLDELPSYINNKLLDGSSGANRASQRCLIPAENDYEAIYSWLAEYKTKSPVTYRHYRKEAERFLLWSIFQQRKALSSLGKNDIEDYLKFLADPQPKELWCGKKSGRKEVRGTKDWHPFVRGLSESSRKTAITIIDSLFKYLYQARYLESNPLDLMRLKTRFGQDKSSRQVLVQKRILQPEELKLFIAALNELSEANEADKLYKARLNFLFAAIYFLGLRVSELVAAKWKDFQEINGKWWFIATGKGGKTRMIPVVNLLPDIVNYRNYLNIPPYPQEENQPLIGSLKDTNKPITCGRVNQMLKELAIKAGEKSESTTHKKKFKKFSAHWLRHLSATMQDYYGVAGIHISENMGHEKQATTDIYRHSIADKRHEDMHKLVLWEAYE